jgi:putative secretion ATPase (PEP-CTERM system associated)
MDYLQYGIGERVGFILLTGEVGSGKTTILRDLIRTLDSGTPVSMVFNTRVDGVQLLAMINEDFGLSPEGRDKPSLLRDLNDFLIEQHALSLRPIIIIDEAQNLTPDALEEIRLLSNLETDSLKLVQIILVGQPELRDLIGAPALRQLRQRISVNCHLIPLTRQETEAYVYHRLEVAGNRQAAVFETGVFDIIFQFSTGIPRRINLFCDFVLLAAFIDGSRQITRDLAAEVGRDLAWEQALLPPLQSSGPSGKKSNALTMEVFRLLTSIQNQVAGLNPLIEDVAAVKKGLEEQAGLIQKLEQQKPQYQRMEETLARIDQVLAEEAKAREAKGRVVELPQSSRDKAGLLARLFG